MNSSISVVCPICSGVLSRLGQSYTCQKRHNFDLTKEGYLSLLHGRGNYQQIGDDKLMVQARVRVHKLPPYVELAKSIAGFAPQMGTGFSILDIGCGDGFFLSEVAETAGVPRLGVGIDVSKGALAKAAKRFPNLFFVRTDALHDRLPFNDSSFGLILSVFAPRPIDEIRRVLKADGCWLIVTATQDHLKEIRNFVPLAAIGTGKLEAPTSRSFSVLKNSTAEYELQVARHDLASIIEMSPSIHRLRKAHGEKWVELLPEGLKVTFSFSIALLGKGAP
jgi:23S rRNA (guanine745-N1)-methyltransferase